MSSLSDIYHTMLEAGRKVGVGGIKDSHESCKDSIIAVKMYGEAIKPVVLNGTLIDNHIRNIYGEEVLSAGNSKATMQKEAVDAGKEFSAMIFDNYIKKAVDSKASSLGAYDFGSNESLIDNRCKGIAEEISESIGDGFRKNGLSGSHDEYRGKYSGLMAFADSVLIPEDIRISSSIELKEILRNIEESRCIHDSDIEQKCSSCEFGKGICQHDIMRWSCAVCRYIDIYTQRQTVGKCKSHMIYEFCAGCKEDSFDSILETFKLKHEELYPLHVVTHQSVENNSITGLSGESIVNLHNMAANELREVYDRNFIEEVENVAKSYKVSSFKEAAEKLDRKIESEKKPKKITASRKYRSKSDKMMKNDEVEDTSLFKRVLKSIKGKGVLRTIVGIIVNVILWSAS